MAPNEKLKYNNVNLSDPILLFSSFKVKKNKQDVNNGHPNNVHTPIKMTTSEGLYILLSALTNFHDVVYG